MSEHADIKKFVPVEQARKNEILSMANNLLKNTVVTLEKELDKHILVMVDTNEGEVDDQATRFKIIIINTDDDEELAVINWLLQDPTKPDIMHDGLVSVKPQLADKNLGYELFKTKRKIGGQLGYKQILVNDHYQTGYVSHILSQPEEDGYNWQEITGAPNLYLTGKTYIANIMPTNQVEK